MAEMKIAPYGSWRSPISAELVATAGIDVRRSRVWLDGSDTYWDELRPAEGGRYVIVRCAPDGTRTDVTPAGFSVRTTVHEYGGGAWCVSEGTVWFSNFADQRLYRQDPGQAPRPITPERALRYADAAIDRRRGRLVLVREDHTVEGREAVNTLVSLPMDGDAAGGRVIVSGNDFYSTPRLSPDGEWLAWQTWNHPNMPWDGSEIWVGRVLEDGSIGESRLVAGGLDESTSQPAWSPDGTLYFISDRSGWWNLYRRRDGRVEAVCPIEAEFAQPQWTFGISTYGFESPDRIICAYVERGTSRLARLDPATGKLEPIDCPYTDIRNLAVAPGRAVFVGGSPTAGLAIVEADLRGEEPRFTRLSSPPAVSIDARYFSTARPIEFPTEGGRTAHAFFYPPHNPDFAAPPGELPPLLVQVHGGPTGATTSTLQLTIQYWTSRGIAVVDVNYGGSTGYGRDYRRRLNGQWGVVDVDDAVNAARYLVERGEVDPNRLMISGGSAGGYTTLCAVTFRDRFKAGASHFGIGDLETFVHDTHKFESRYVDSLVGPYPEQRERYRERSAINYADRLAAPVIFFQGLEDKIVPPNQAEAMVAALRAKGLPVAYLAYPGEQHGFRQAKNIQRTLEAELYFYARVFGFDLADPVEPVPIENLPSQ